MQSFRAPVLAAALLWVVPLSAQTPLAPLPVPQGEVVLTVTGKISQTNHGDAAQFDRAMLKALGTETYEITSPWLTGTNTFTGVPLYRLLDRLGASADEIHASALNDYTAVIPRSDAVPNGIFIALEINGGEMTTRDRGPLWMLYPFDQHPEYRSEVGYARSIWQLHQLDVRPALSEASRP